MKIVHINVKQKEIFERGRYTVGKDNPTLQELIDTLEKIKKKHPDKKLLVGLNTWDEQLWISTYDENGKESDKVECAIPLLQWN
jgi:hypothetical protein